MDDQVGSPPPWPAAAAGSAQPEGLSGVLDHEQVPGADDAAQSAARLRGDRKLWDVLAAEAFAGPAYAAFEEQIARYGVQIMNSGLATRYIFVLCRQVGLSLLSQPIPRCDREDLAQETVAETLRVFKSNAQNGRGWSPEGGASLKTYFTRALCFQFANVWKKRLRAASSTAAGLSLDSLSIEIESPEPGPAEICLERDMIRCGLAEIGDATTCAAVALTEDGYTQKEIAEILGPDVTPTPGTLGVWGVQGVPSLVSCVCS
jgi:DNA-directed RNA polymerase specialized sigma24 family protein